MMPTKTERFETWRGKDAAKETKYIGASNAFDAFIQDVILKNGGLAAIKTVLSDPLSTIYTTKDIHTNADTQLNPSSRYSLGALVYCKFAVIDVIEALGKLPSPPHDELRILNNLSNVLGNLYLASPIKNRKKDMDGLLENANAFLMIKPEDYADRKLAIALYHSLYATFTTTLAASNLSTDIDATAARLVGINIENLKPILNDMLEMLDIKLAVLNAATTNGLSSEHAIVAPKTIQDYLNESCLAVLNPDALEIDRHSALNTRMGNITEGITNLIEAKIEAETNKKSIEVEIAAVKGLLNKVKLNDEKIHGRKYFLDLVDADPAYLALMQTSTGAIKEQLDTDVVQLREQSSFTGAAYNLASWATFPITLFFRLVAPTAVQDVLKAVVPDTLDSACKAGLKILLTDSLVNLGARLRSENHKIKCVAAEISDNQAEFTALLIKSSVEELEAIVNTNKALTQTLVQYISLSTAVKNKMAFLDTIKDSSATLKTFVKNCDGIAVAISNFFAHYISIFKSKTARMIDDARILQKKLAELEEAYNTETEACRADMLNYSNIPQDIKDSVDKALNVLATTQDAMALANNLPIKEAARKVIDNFPKMLTNFMDNPEQESPSQSLLRL